jgi:hypothetical protein
MMRPHFLLLISAALAGSAFTCAADEPAAKSAEPKKENFTPGGKWKHGDMNRPRPRVITPPGMSTQAAPGQPPSDAIVLFNGTDLSKWKRDKPAADGDDKAPWKVGDGYFEVVPKTGYLRTREKIKGDTQWHIEWATPSEVKGNSQGRGNSGVFLTGYPELQVLDSFENDTYPDGQAAASGRLTTSSLSASRRMTPAR